MYISYSPGRGGCWAAGATGTAADTATPTPTSPLGDATACCAAACAAAAAAAAAAACSLAALAAFERRQLLISSVSCLRKPWTVRVVPEKECVDKGAQSTHHVCTHCMAQHTHAALAHLQLYSFLFQRLFKGVELLGFCLNLLCLCVPRMLV